MSDTMPSIEDMKARLAFYKPMMLSSDVALCVETCKTGLVLSTTANPILSEMDKPIIYAVIHDMRKAQGWYSAIRCLMNGKPGLVVPGMWPLPLEPFGIKESHYWYPFQFIPVYYPISYEGDADV